MTFQPVLPADGVLGFRLLERTEATQRSIFDRQPEITRDTTYFRENIAGVTTAAELVADRRLLKVALGAFGLDAEINKGAFIRKILEEGTDDPQSFANRLVDPRYSRFAEQFAFGNVTGPLNSTIGFADAITAAYTERQFEIAVGAQDETLRIALNFRREIQRYATAGDPDGTAWFSVMGDPPVRRVFERAFGLPEAFGQLNIDRQQQELRERNRVNFGDTSLAIFTDPKRVNQIIERYLLREAINSGPGPGTPGFTALTLLGGGSGGLGPAGVQNIVLSDLESLF
ncbi:MAG: DUF1217 domain-containing protein [Pseudomonadota bacterium]